MASDKKQLSKINFLNYRTARKETASLFHFVALKNKADSEKRVRVLPGVFRVISASSRLRKSTDQ